MAYRGNRFGDRTDVSEVYSPEQVEAVLNACHVEVAGETGNDFLCFCPFHGNKYTPSFSVSKTTGVYICFNHACGVSGQILELVQATTDSNQFEAMRLVAQMKSGSQITLADRRARRQKAQEARVFPSEILEKMKTDFWKGSPALDYMRTRGFDDATLESFNVGFSAAKGLVATPMYDVDGKPVGVIGRSIGTDKRFKNSVGLPTSRTLWNIHNAKKAGDTVIICEANFDGMKIAQAGYPGVVACLGGNFSADHADQLARYFTKIIIMTDNDDKAKHIYKGCKKCAAKGHKYCQGHNPGRALGATIASEMAKRARNVQWASYSTGDIYPNGAKDAGDMTDEEIRQCIENAVSNFKYNSWKISF